MAQGMREKSFTSDWVGHHEQQERRTGNNVLEKDRGAAILSR
jgi:hypothetical protein